MFYERLKELIKEKKITLAFLSRELNFSHSNAQNWNNGVLPSGEILLKIANYFNVSTDFLLGREEKGSNKILSQTEQNLIEYYRNFNAEGKEKLIAYAEDLNDGGRYIKNSADTKAI